MKNNRRYHFIAPHTLCPHITDFQSYNKRPLVIISMASFLCYFKYTLSHTLSEQSKYQDFFQVPVFSTMRRYSEKL